ncbi:MAG: GNAT family N-acetyltransferase [Candidatus Pacebacteria bacterium]|nr:GNAT family N-acetyltransferase [Candidatus Paceibacterota bacterium]MDD2757412.1 GNAT family N-acetyltransferase [Candidatus Paceibacterota bacterium]MDD3970070.1 GNAT family N-acetyltransferase [Candidatus Paceibacterota bacterium]
MNIRRAETKDLKDIIKIIKSIHINNVKNNKDNGFLATKDLSEETYKSKINKYDYCYTYESEDKIVGFLIASSSELMQKTNEIYPFLLSCNLSNDFIYIFQIGISPDYQRKGIAKLLYNRLFKDAKINNLTVISSKNPFNKASREFHLKLGFEDEGVFKWSDGVESYVYNLKLKTKTRN